MADLDINDLSIEAVDIDLPRAAENNNKDHTPDSVKKLAKSLAKLGQITPIILDRDDEIIAGHGRVLAAKELGWSKIKAIRLPVDARTAREMRIADNLASNQNYDLEALTKELADLDLGEELDALINDDRMRDNLDIAMKTLEEMSHEAFVKDLDKAVDEYAEESDDLMDEIDEKDVPLKQIFEFSSFKPKEARRVNLFLAMIRGKGDQDTKQSFLAHVEKIIAEG
jgi:hypothetical protein